MAQRLAPDAALKTLAAQPGRLFTMLFRHGTLAVEIYKPDAVDRQQPHDRDEIPGVIRHKTT